MSSLLRHVALVPDDNIGIQLSSSDITRVAAALQKQVARDFGPVWDVKATVDAFAKLDDVPLGYWPILVGRKGRAEEACTWTTTTNPTRSSISRRTGP